MYVFASQQNRILFSTKGWGGGCSSEVYKRSGFLTSGHRFNPLIIMRMASRTPVLHTFGWFVIIMHKNSLTGTCTQLPFWVYLGHCTLYNNGDLNCTSYKAFFQKILILVPKTLFCYKKKQKTLEVDSSSRENFDDCY